MKHNEVYNELQLIWDWTDPTNSPNKNKKKQDRRWTPTNPRPP